MPMYIRRKPMMMIPSSIVLTFHPTNLIRKETKKNTRK